MTAPDVKVTADDLLAVAKIADAIACRDLKRADKIAAAHRATATAPLEARIAALEGAMGKAREGLEDIAGAGHPDFLSHSQQVARTTLASLRAMLANPSNRPPIDPKPIPIHNQPPAISHPPEKEVQ